MTTNRKKVNRWQIAIFGVLMQICLGTVYGWSIFTKPLESLYHWDRTAVTIVFSIAIGCLGLAAALGGMLADKKGPRFVAILGGILFGSGTILTGLAIQMGSLAFIYVSYGVIAGLGIGLAYITPISVLVKWFPDKRGLITGLAVMGFGFGAFFMTTFIPLVIDALKPVLTFYLLGIIFLVVVVIAGIFMVNPPKDYVVSGFESKKSGQKSVDIEPSKAVKTSDFWLFWSILFLNISAGIALISQASPMVQEIFNQTPIQAGVIIGIFSLFNGLGRLFWSWISDFIGRRNVFIIFFITQAIVFLTIPYVTNLTVFIIMGCYIYACYGGGFSTMPAYVADTFGSKFVGTTYGWIVTAWSVAAIAGPIFYSTMKQATNSYSMALTVTGISLIVAILLPMFVGTGKKTNIVI